MKKQRKQYAPEEKVAILRRHLLEKEPISKLCDEVGLQPTVFYRWQKEFFENGAAAFEQKRPTNHSADQERIAYLQKKIQTKDEVLAELMAEHVALKKGNYILDSLYLIRWLERGHMGKISLSTSHPFVGIAEKLNRSNENIRNLESEIAAFFDESKYPLLSDDNQKVISEAVEYHRSRQIPPRFSILSGEIIHHLRSCLDHLIWHFSDVTYRETSKNRKFIEFPILEKPPSDVSTQYERKIQGITNTAVRSLIEECQPYKRPNPNESLLLAVHSMDIVDKHRELVIVESTGAAHLPIDLWKRYENGELPISTIGANFKQYGKLIPQIAFSDFCGAESEIVPQALILMYNEVFH